MDDEIFIVIVVAIISSTVLITSIFKTIMTFAAGKQARKGESSLTMSELEALLRRVVEESTEPLAERLDALEDRLDGRLLDAPREPTVQETFGAEEPAPVRRSSP